MEKRTCIGVILIAHAGCGLCKNTLFIRAEEQTIKVTQKKRHKVLKLFK